jgi:YHS domain-containing protein
MDLQFSFAALPAASAGAAPDGVRAGYSCPCGCTPAVEYRRGEPAVTDDCCCGNQFAVGTGAVRQMAAIDGVTREVRWFDAPWGERLPAVWNLRLDREPAPGEDAHAAGHDHGHGDDAASEAAAEALDPVCGMRVVPAEAMSRGLHSRHAGTDYSFCGRGCKLEFDENPGRFLAPGYVPSM